MNAAATIGAQIRMVGQQLKSLKTPAERFAAKLAEKANATKPTAADNEGATALPN